MAWIGLTGPAALLAMSIAVTACAQAQVWLRTIVELAQRNSTAVRAAQADVIEGAGRAFRKRRTYCALTQGRHGHTRFP